MVRLPIDKGLNCNSFVAHVSSCQLFPSILKAACGRGRMPHRRATDAFTFLSNLCWSCYS